MGFICCLFAVLPSISHPVNGTTVNVNESNPVNISCKGNGIPVPDLVWEKDGLNVSAPRIGDLTIGTKVGSHWLNHTISSASHADTAWYTCVANNTLLNIEQKVDRSIYVNVQGKVKSVEE